MWKTSVGWLRPVIQTTDLTVALGLALGPQIVKPFLGRINNETDITNNKTILLTPDYELQPIQLAFLIVSAFDILMVIVSMSMFACSSIRIGNELGMFFRDADDDDMQLIPDGELPKGMEEPCNPWGCFLLTLAYLLLVTYSGVVVLFAGLLFTYLYEYLGWSVDASTLLATMFQLSNFVFGTAMIVLTRWVSPFKLSIFNLVMWCISCVMLLASLVGNGRDAFVVIGVVCASVMASNMYPTTIMLVEQTMHVVAPVMALFITSIGLSNMILGPVTGALLHNIGVVAFPSIILALFVTATVLFSVYSVLTRVK